MLYLPAGNQYNQHKIKCQTQTQMFIAFALRVFPEKQDQEKRIR